MREAFADRAFNPREASVVLGVGADTARHLLRDLRITGQVERIDRGRYRVRVIPDRLRIERARLTLRLEPALDTDLRIALDGPDAVHAWTEGRYTAGLRPDVLYIVVDHGDEAAYKEHLEENHLSYGPEPDPPRGRGPYVALRVATGFRTVHLEDVPVIDREATLAYIRANPVAYDGAEEWFR